MDDNGNSIEINDDTVLRLTPKGFFMQQLQKHGATRNQASEEWHRLEAFCVKRSVECGDHSHAALVFDGEGGSIFGVNIEHDDSSR